MELPLIPLILAFAGTSALLPVLVRRMGTRIFYVAAAAPVAALVWAAANWERVLDGGHIDEAVSWVPGLSLSVGLRADGFGLLMVAVVAGIGVLIFVYARSYFDDGTGHLGRFAATLLVFAGSMVGLVLAGDLLTLFLFWELTSITSFLLIGTDDERTAARSGALQALLITGLGGLAMLAGFILLGESAGTYELSAILADPPSGASVDIALVLVLVGALTKSAQVPFHSWLPRAMNAPTPVSAYLHSATMVKAGVYLVARFSPAFAGYAPWRPMVVGAGLLSMLIGGYRALRQHDIKLLLAHGTISQLGLMMVLFGVGTAEAATAGCVLLIAHAVFKAALFMLVGVVDHQTHTRDLRRLDGLGRRWPLVAATAGVAAASMAGLPPLLGFVAKEGALASLGTTGWVWGPWLLAGVVAGSALTVAYSARFVWGAFGAAERDALGPVELIGADAPHARQRFVAPAVVLAGASIVLGLRPELLDGAITSAQQALWPGEVHAHLALWHGFTAALGLSALAIVGGCLLFVRRAAFERWQSLASGVPSAQRGYERALAAVLEGADRLTGVVQHGSLPIYLGIILLTAIALPAIPLLVGVDVPALRLMESPLQIVVGVVMVSCALAAAVARRRFSAVLLVGAVGYGMAALFEVQGAPDLAITQLLVETLSVVVFVLVFRHLPDRFSRSEVRGTQFPRVVIAVAAAVFVFVLTMASTGGRTEAPISNDYLARALPEGGGSNVVNVIVVDFRGFDTMGEITVLVITALGVAAIVRSRRPDDPSDAPEGPDDGAPVRDVGVEVHG